MVQSCISRALLLTIRENMENQSNSTDFIVYLLCARKFLSTGDSTEKDSRSPPRQPWDPFLGGQNVLKAVRLTENLEHGLHLLLEVARLDGQDTCLKAFKNDDQQSENKEAETCFSHT